KCYNSQWDKKHSKLAAIKWKALIVIKGINTSLLISFPEIFIKYFQVFIAGEDTFRKIPKKFRCVLFKKFLPLLLQDLSPHSLNLLQFNLLQLTSHPLL
uniref:Uncharacterized protein n=1 Tax=Ciona intestinalis TaxID=7719 RepID=F6UM10_CIOIN